MQSTQTRRSRFPTLDHVWLFAAVALIAMRPLLTPIPPHDFWWHMAMGRLIVQSGTIPQVDTFSYTQAGEPFYNQGWLSQVLMYGLHQAGGIPLILVVQALVVTLAYGLLLWLCIRRSGALRLSVALLLLTTMPLSFDNWNVRPQTYAFPLFVAFLIILTRYRETTPPDGATPPRHPLLQGRLWLLPLLMVVWVNLHGSFVLGGGLIALTFVGEVVRRQLARWRGVAITSAPPLWPLFFWGGVTAVTLLVNPRGVGVVGYVFNLMGNSAVTTLVTEWAPPTIRDAGGTIFFLFLILVMVVLAYAPRPPDLVDMLLMVALLWLALGAGRSIIWFGMVATPLLVVQAAAWLQAAGGAATRQPRTGRARTSAGVPALNAALMGVIALMVLLTLPWVKPLLDLPPEVGALLSDDTPVAAVDYLQSQPAEEAPARLFHAMSYGSYLIWEAPQQPVFIDPRIELYPYQQWLDYMSLSGGNNVDTLLEQYQIDGLLLDNDDQARLVQQARKDPAWQVRYEDAYTTYLTPR